MNPTDPTGLQVLLGLAAIAVIAYFAITKLRSKKKELPDVTRGKVGWTNVNGQIALKVVNGLPSFNFGEPHAIINYGQRLTLGGTIRVRYRVTGGGFAPVQYPDKTPLIGLIIQRKGDNHSGVGEYANHRWYTTGYYALAAGEHEFYAQLAPDLWTNVQGQHDPAGFAAAIANAAGAGITFGHDSGRAHGVRADAGSTFELVDWGVSQ